MDEPRSGSPLGSGSGVSYVVKEHPPRHAPARRRAVQPHSYVEVPPRVGKHPAAVGARGVARVMAESVIAVFILGAIAGGTGTYIWCQRTVRQWQRATLEAKEQSLMRAKLLNAVLKLARDAGALDAVTGELTESDFVNAPPPRLTVVKP